MLPWGTRSPIRVVRGMLGHSKWPGRCRPQGQEKGVKGAVWLWGWNPKLCVQIPGMLPSPTPADCVPLTSLPTTQYPSHPQAARDPHRVTGIPESGPSPCAQLPHQRWGP